MGAAELVLKLLEEKKIRNFIYLSKIDTAVSQNELNALLQMISKENREKCQRFRFKADALRTLYGELIVRHVLCQRFLLKNEAIEILKRNDGKPYVKGFPVHFNISHAGDFVVCVFGEQEVGVDIEQIKEIDLKIAKRFFCPCEYEDLFTQKVADRLDYFYALWTLKESYLKWLGTGMSIPLDSFCFKIRDGHISCLDEHRKIIPFFKQYFVEGYKLAICSMIQDFPSQIERINLEEIRFGGG